MKKTNHWSFYAATLSLTVLMGAECLEYDPTFVAGTTQRCQALEGLSAGLAGDCLSYCQAKIVVEEGEELSEDEQNALLGEACIELLANTGGGGGEGSGGEDFVASTPCSSAGEAKLRAREFDYPIDCGCAEEAWGEEEGSKDCTVPLGTKVTWSFVGGEQHNVVELNTVFESENISSGRFDHLFDAPGTYSYECTLHSLSMTGYTVKVLGAAE